MLLKKAASLLLFSSSALKKTGPERDLMREYENNSTHAYLTTLSLKQAVMDIIFEF